MKIEERLTTVSALLGTKEFFREIKSGMDVKSEFQYYGVVAMLVWASDSPRMERRRNQARPGVTGGKVRTE